MKIVEVSTGISRTVVVRIADDDDFKILSKKRYSFSWKSFRTDTIVYKLMIDGEEDILGAMGLVDVPDGNFTLMEPD
jgi:hypothetical protein